MNILLLNHYAGSPALGMEYRPYYLAREWARAGRAVHILAADFPHVRSAQPAAGDELVVDQPAREIHRRFSEHVVRQIEATRFCEHSPARARELNAIDCPAVQR